MHINTITIALSSQVKLPHRQTNPLPFQHDFAMLMGKRRMRWWFCQPEDSRYIQVADEADINACD